MPKSCTGSRYTGYSCTSSRFRKVASAVTGPGVTTWRLVSISPRSASTTKPVACAEVLRSVSNEADGSICIATTLPAMRSSVAAQSAADASSAAGTATVGGIFGGVGAPGAGDAGATPSPPGGVLAAVGAPAAGTAAVAGGAGPASAAAAAASAAQIARAGSLNVIVHIQTPLGSGHEIHPDCSDAAACRAVRS